MRRLRITKNEESTNDERDSVRQKIVVYVAFKYLTIASKQKGVP